MMIRFDPGYLTFEKPLFMLSPDQQEQFKRELQEKDDKIWIKNLVGIEDDTLYDDVVAGFERMGYEPTLPEFVQKYNQLKELRSATK